MATSGSQSVFGPELGTWIFKNFINYKNDIFAIFIKLISLAQSWALVVLFFIFSIVKNDIFGIYYQVNLTGGRLFN